MVGKGVRGVLPVHQQAAQAGKRVQEARKQGRYFSGGQAFAFKLLSMCAGELVSRYSEVPGNRDWQLAHDRWFSYGPYWEKSPRCKCRLRQGRF